VDSINQIKQFEKNPDHAVHEFRKNMKKKAVLRMVRFSMPPLTKYSRLNTRKPTFKSE
jgi:hypothetical protein